MWKEITKAKARSLFLTGHTVHILSSKLNPDNIWQKPYAVSPDWENNFDAACDSYTYYNCNSASGKGLRYYIAV